MRFSKQFGWLPLTLSFFACVNHGQDAPGVKEGGKAMGIFDRLFGRGSKSEKQEVLIYLDGTSLPDAIYEKFDTSTLEDRLAEVLTKNNLGEVDGTETGPTETTVFLFGADAERLYQGIEETLRAYPLCQNARVVIRKGGPGSTERQIRLPRA